MFRAWSRGAEHRCPRRKPGRTEKQPPPPRLPPLQHVRHVLGAFQDRRVRAGSEGFLTAGHRGETSQGKEVFCVLRKG